MAPRTRLKSLHRLVERMMSVCWDTIQKVVPSQCTPDAKKHSKLSNEPKWVAVRSLWKSDINHDGLS